MAIMQMDCHFHDCVFFSTQWHFAGSSLFAVIDQTCYPVVIQAYQRDNQDCDSMWYSLAFNSNFLILKFLILCY